MAPVMLPAAGKEVLGAGLMSGTSCDGTSGALVAFRVVRGKPHTPAVRLLALAHVPYPRDVRSFLLRLASGDPAPARDFARASELLARWSARAVSTLLKRARVPRRRLSFVGVHGHTLYHGPRDRRSDRWDDLVIPRDRRRDRWDDLVIQRDHESGRWGGKATPRDRRSDRRAGITWQACDLPRLAEMSGTTVVGDFRTRDMAAGGEGAPLAPYAHWVLFTNQDLPRLVLNLGGIANVTWLPAGARFPDVRAFDTGPGNMLLDLLAARATAGRLNRDEDGRLAARGRVDRRVLRRLMAHRYFSRRPPKSTGREEFGRGMLAAFRGLSGPDALATATAFTGESVAGQLGRWLPPAARRATVYACGGGARNPSLMRALRAALAPRWLLPVDVLGLPGEAVEPVAFALLARARLLGLPNVMPAVTGARRAVSAGVVVPA